MHSVHNKLSQNEVAVGHFVMGCIVASLHHQVSWLMVMTTSFVDKKAQAFPRHCKQLQPLVILSHCKQLQPLVTLGQSSHSWLPLQDISWTCLCRWAQRTILPSVSSGFSIGFCLVAQLNRYVLNFVCPICILSAAWRTLSWPDTAMPGSVIVPPSPFT